MLKTYEKDSMTGLEIAVVGMAGRFPGAKNIDEFWENLRNGVETISFFSDNELIEQGIDLKTLENPNYIKAKGVLEGIENFDHDFFGYSYGDAYMMDPQLKILHECCWEALECAAYNPENYKGLIGVYVGGNLNLSWLSKFLMQKATYAEQTHLNSLNDISSLSTRISYNLNLRGPSYTINTACSSSLVTIHLACQSLLSCECDMALAGGVSISLPKKSGYQYQNGMVVSSDGHCRAFDEKADGTVAGDGIGIVVLKRLEDAINDGDHIYSIIKGSATNNDGLRKVGYTAPSIDGQAEAIRVAQQVAEVPPESISYVEAHGTGTVLGDPIELEGLKLAFNTKEKQYCRIGSVKTNIGHLGNAAGVAGFIKTVLSLENRLIVPSLNYHKPNPKINFENSPFFVNKELTKWDNEKYPLRAGVSSFGIGGTNAHIILEEYEEIDKSIATQHNIITLSARTQGALEKMTDNLLEFLKKGKANNISDIAYTLQIGRKDFPYRRVLVASSVEEVIDKLSALDNKNVITNFVKDEEKNIAFMFPGQGSQYVNMGRELYENNNLFKEEMDYCFSMAEDILGYDLKDVIFPSESCIRDAEVKINKIQVIQPLVFIVEYSLAKVLISWGISPKTMIGYSLGEYVAACIAGVFSLEDALKIVIARGRLLSEVPQGAMISVPLSEEHLKEFLNEELSVSISNVDSCVVSGTKEAINDLENKLKENKCICMRLNNLHIGHSKAVECILDNFSNELEKIKLNEPKIRYISSMTGNWIEDGEVTKPSYWINHLRKTVRFTGGVNTLLKESNYTLIEVGPGRDLSVLISRYIDKSSNVAIMNTIPHKSKADSQEYHLFKQVGLLWSLGFNVNWHKFNQDLELKRVYLPTYPFEEITFDITVPMNFQEICYTEKREEADKINAVISKDKTTNVRSSKGEKHKEPSNETEKIILEILQSMFKEDTIGTDEDFFELGGDSLKATILVGKIFEKLNLEIPVHEIFNNPTVEEISKYIIGIKESMYVPIEIVQPKEYYSLTSQQKGIFASDKLGNNSMSYHIPLTMKLEGNVKKELVEKAFFKIVERHDSLRTGFKIFEGEVVQYVMKEIDFKIEYVEAKEEELAKIKEEFIRPFDLSKAPLFRVKLVKISEGEYILMLDMHHIVVDGTSMIVIVDEFLQLYENKELSPVKLQYKDYENWQKNMRNSIKLKKQEEYWLDLFSGEIPILNLPTDYARPAIKSFEGKTYGFSINRSLTLKLHELANKYNTTLYMVLLTAYNILLNKYTNQEDIVIGSPFAGRAHPDLEKVVGMFVNTVALRNYPQGSITVEEFLIQVRENTLKAYSNQEYQFEELVENLNIRRDMSRNPLFDTMLLLQNMEIGNTEMDEVGVSIYGIDVNNTSKFDITLTFFEGADGLECSFEYCAKLFKSETIERLKDHLLKVMNEMVEKPYVKISDIDILSESEKYDLIYKFNNTKAEYEKDKTIQELFEAQVEKASHNIAVVFEDKKLTYRELNERANSLATVLRDKGVKADSIVGIMVERSLEMIVGIMGILKAGGAYLPIDPSYPKERIEYMLKDSESKILLSSDILVEDIKYDGETVNLFDEKLFKNSTTNVEIINKSKDLAYVIYTSGTTGNPKGVMVEHRQVTNFIEGIVKETKLNIFKNVLCSTTICFDIFGLETLVPLTLGLNIVVTNGEEQIDGDKLGEVIEKNKIEIMQSTPSRLKMLLENKVFEKSLINVKLLLIGGEKVNDSLAATLHESIDAKIYNVYGPSETTIWSTAKELNKDEKVTIGKPISNTQIYIVNNNVMMPIGVPGELCIGGHGLARGYLNRPELTAEKFIENPFEPGRKMYKTGDLARWLPDGNIEFLGRIDNQVKIRGFRIELGEIESVLLSYENIKEAIVIAKDDENLEKYLCAYYVSIEEINISDLRRFLSDKLPNYMIPAYFISLDELPITANGKINRTLLPEPNDSMTFLDNYALPENQFEKHILEIWEQVLGINKKGISVEHNFFELGGHSLKALKVINQIKKNFGLGISMQKFLETPTIRGIANNLSQMDKMDFIDIEKIKEKEYYEVSYNQKRLWLINELDPHNSSYNMYGKFELHEEIKKEIIEKIADKIMKRHESLRTGFKNLQGDVVQFIDNNAYIHVEEVDVSYLSEDEKAIEVDKIYTKELHKSFDLTKPPLFRVKMIKVSEKKYNIFYTMHHIVSDGWSMEVIKKEFASLYNEYNTGEKAELEDVIIQYKDYAAWQNRLLKDTTFKANAHDYWLSVLSKDNLTLSLPKDFNVSSESKIGGGYRFAIEDNIKNNIKNMAKENNTTLFVVMFSAFNILLTKLTGSKEIICGVPCAGRQHPSLQNVVGFFVNTMILRNDIDYEESFNNLIRTVNDNVMEAFKYQSYPVELVLNDLKISYPKFPAFFNMLNIDDDILKAEIKSFKPYFTEISQDSKFDLTLYIEEHVNGIEINFNYRKAMFKEQTIEYFAEEYIKILDYISSNSNRNYNSYRRQGKNKAI